MEFWDRVRSTIDKGLEGSREILGKARDKAQDLGERGVLRIEIAQLENRAERLVSKLGAVAYEALVVDKSEQLLASDEAVKEVLGEIKDVQNRIADKEGQLEIARRKETPE